MTVFKAAHSLTLLSSECAGLGDGSAKLKDIGDSLAAAAAAATGCLALSSDSSSCRAYGEPTGVVRKLAAPATAHKQTRQIWHQSARTAYRQAQSPSNSNTQNGYPHNTQVLVLEPVTSVLTKECLKTKIHTKIIFNTTLRFLLFQSRHMP